MEELFVLLDTGCNCLEKENRIGATIQELTTMYKEEFPYKIVDTIDGQCIQWDEVFIEKCTYAMSSGSLEDLSDIEKQIWYHFVEFQDEMSNSAPSSYVGAIGCTIPNALGESFVVTENGVSQAYCDAPSASVPKERQSASLDAYFMDLYNCETPNDCGIIAGEVEDVSPCSI